MGATPPQLRIAVIGCGRQGHRLIQSINQIDYRMRPAIAALCDPWPLALRSARLLAQGANCVSSPEELFDPLGSNLALDAALIASPDYLHESQAKTCLERGLHVYLEPPMAGSAEAARSLVATAAAHSRLLQVGYQRRSHPNYRFAFEPEFRERIFGVMDLIGNASLSLGAPIPPLQSLDPESAVPPEVLERLGVGTMERYLDWRPSKMTSVGWLRNEASHQIDVQNWVLGKPRSVIAAGSNTSARSEHLDNVDTVLDYDGKDGSTSRAIHHLQVGHSLPITRESFHSPDCTVTFSEEERLGFLCPETHLRGRDFAERRGLRRYLERRYPHPQLAGDQDIYQSTPDFIRCFSGTTPYTIDSLYFKAPFSRPLWRAHLENLFDAIAQLREGEPPQLNCPGAEGYNTTLTCLRAEQAVAARQRLHFDPSQWL